MSYLDHWLPPVAVLVIYVVRMAELATPRDTIAGPIPERLTLRLFMLAGTLMLAGGITEHFLHTPALHWPLFLTGLASGLASFTIRRQAIRALGRFWSLHVEIRENHQFVSDGPFRWVRHPTYFSMILELLAAGLILRAWATLALVSLIFIPALYRRIRLEETALVQKFGPRYTAYQQSTPALLPTKFPPAP